MASSPASAEDAARAGLWSAVDIFLRQGVQFAVTIVLARLVAPQEFGTIALMAVFTSLISILIEGGGNTALVRSGSSTALQESSVFWFNLGAGVVGATILVAAAPFIASFYGIPTLVPL